MDSPDCARTGGAQATTRMKATTARTRNLIRWLNTHMSLPRQSGWTRLAPRSAGAVGELAGLLPARAGRAPTEDGVLSRAEAAAGQRAQIRRERRRQTHSSEGGGEGHALPRLGDGRPHQVDDLAPCENMGQLGVAQRDRR